MPNPAKPVQAVLVAGVFSMLTGYINWAFCLVSCALFTPFLMRRNPQTDVRALIAVTRLRFGEIVGYTFLVTVVLFAANVVAMLMIPATL